MGSCISKRRLARLDPDKIENFNFMGSGYQIKVCSVYDGDTITGIMKFRGKYGKFKIRMEGYDSPEMKPPLSDPERVYEIEAAKQAKEVLQTLILNKIVEGECYGTDKYGRLLMTIFYKEKNINKLMIDCGYGYAYEGKSKTKFDKSNWNPKDPGKM
jgi:endonuclease YncB( thermonuclease family)